MKIEFDTERLNAREARGLLALLQSACPDVLADAIGENVVTIAAEPVALSPALTPEPQVHYAFGAASAGGEPAPVTDPAAAFGAPAAPLASPAVGGAPAPVASVPSAPTPPAPVAPAPSASVATPTTSPSSERDIHGLPYDARIHSTPAKKNQDGSWRSKRGVSNELMTQVTAELRAAVGAPAAPAPVPPAPVPPAAAPAPLPPQAVAAAQAAALADPSLGAAPALAPAPVAAPSGPQLFAGLMRKVTPAQAAGKLTTEQVNAVATGLGLPNLAALIHRPDLVPTAEAQIDALIAAAG